MNLVLAGTWASEDPDEGLCAFIGESANTARMFAVGSPCGPAPRCSRSPDRTSTRTASASRSSCRAFGNTNLAAHTRRHLHEPEPASQDAENLRRMAESSPAAFSEIVRPQPVFANGVQRGYRVYPGRNRQQFAKLGLRPGDLVPSINGTPLDDPARGMEIFNAMGASDRVTVTVERNGQPQELTLNMAQLSVPESAAAKWRPARRTLPHRHSRIKTSP